MEQRRYCRTQDNPCKEAALSALPTICSGNISLGDIFARKPQLAFLALAGEQAWWVLTVEVDVGEHGRRTAVAVIIEVHIEWAGKFLESSAALASRKFRPFALACDDCVVLELKAHRAILLGLQQAPPRGSSGHLEHAVGQERSGGRGDPGQGGGREEEEEQEPAVPRHRPRVLPPPEARKEPAAGGGDPEVLIRGTARG